MKSQDIRNIIIVLTLINVFYSCGIFKGEKASAVPPNKIVIKSNFSTRRGAGEIRNNFSDI